MSSMQAGDASGTGVFDTANRTYDKRRLGSIDSQLEDKFPQLIGPNEVCPVLSDLKYQFSGLKK